MGFDIKQMDAIAFIKELKEKNKTNFIDAVITDPPYNISKDNNFKTIGRAGINFGLWDYGFDQTTWIEEISPLIKSGGTMIIFNDWKNMGEISKTLANCGFETKDLIRWIKKNPMPRNVSRRYVVDYEFAIWAVKKGKWVFNKNINNQSINNSYIRPEYNYSLVAKSKKKIHPTQKPLGLIEEIILRHTNKGDVICDPFFGSGTTGLASIRNDRFFIGSEIDEKYFEFANEHIHKEHIKNIENEKVIRSPLYYLGDKYKLLPQIISFFPKKINNFYDVFGGGGTMLANIQFKKGHYNDINKNLKEILKLIYSQDYQITLRKIKKIIKMFDLTSPTDKKRESKKIKNLNYKKFLDLRKKYNSFENKSKKESLYYLIVLIIYSFNSQIRFNSKGNFNIPVGKQDLNENRIKILEDFINSIRKKDVKFTSKDFSFLLKTKFQKDDFVYLDPPYLITNATYNVIWNEKEEEKLLKTLDYLNQKGVKWALSNVIESKGNININLKKWANDKNYLVHDLNFNYKNSNYQRKSKEKDKEVLITN